jgi:hypothetical protein
MTAIMDSFPSMTARHFYSTCKSLQKNETQKLQTFPFSNAELSLALIKSFLQSAMDPKHDYQRGVGVLLSLDGMESGGCIVYTLVLEAIRLLILARAMLFQHPDLCLVGFEQIVVESTLRSSGLGKCLAFRMGFRVSGLECSVENELSFVCSLAIDERKMAVDTLCRAV